MNLRSGGYREIDLLRLQCSGTPQVTMITLQVIEMVMTTGANRNQIVNLVFVAQPFIGQVVDMLRRLFAHDAQPAINLQPLGAFGLPCCGFQVFLIVHAGTPLAEP